MALLYKLEKLHGLFGFLLQISNFDADSGVSLLRVHSILKIISQRTTLFSYDISISISANRRYKWHRGSRELKNFLILD